jgi:hypothetical protein
MGLAVVSVGVRCCLVELALCRFVAASVKLEINSQCRRNRRRCRQPITRSLAENHKSRGYRSPHDDKVVWLRREFL